MNTLGACSCRPSVVAASSNSKNVLSDFFFFFSSRRRHTRFDCDWSSDVCSSELWYQDSFRRFVIPERIEDAHPTLQPAFRAMAERLGTVTWDGLVAETLAFGSPDTVARPIEYMRSIGVGPILCWMNFGGLAQDKIRRSMELFAREVMPRFRSPERTP